MLDVTCFLIGELNALTFVEPNFKVFAYGRNRSEVPFSGAVLGAGLGKPNSIPLGELLLFLAVDLALGSHRLREMRAISDFIPV